VSRPRVLVCGTTFGQFYVAALNGDFELAGILGRGSTRSVECAARHGVPLYTGVAELPDDLDLACVVVRSGVLGGPGDELAAALLRRGLDVVQEHPVHHDAVAAGLRLAAEQGRRYRVGDLYVHLPAVRRFVAAARALLTEQPAVYVDAACSIQVAFPLVHILGAALGGVRPWRIGEAAGAADDTLRVMTGVVGGVPMVLRVHNEVDPQDPDNHVHLLHRVTIGTAGGALTLQDTHGPVTWTPRLHIPAAVKERFDVDGIGTDHLREPSSIPLGPATPPSYRRILAEQWPAAIRADLRAVREETGGAQRLLSRCRMWQDLTARLGYPVLRQGQRHEPLPSGVLLEAVAGIEDEEAYACQ
jgi:thiazolinyl imide reductase